MKTVLDNYTKGEYGQNNLRLLSQIMPSKSLNSSIIKPAIQRAIKQLNTLNSKSKSFGTMLTEAGKALNTKFKTIPQFLGSKAEENITNTNSENNIDYQENSGIIGEEKLLDSLLSEAQIDGILNTPKGNRPDPSTYLSKEYIDNHLALFKEGISVIQKESAYRLYSEINGFVGIPSDNSLFVMPKSFCDNVILKSNGDISIIEKELGFPEGYFIGGGGLVRIDANNILNLNIRIPSGNETGANNLWVPGGYTSGGVPEAVTNKIPLEDTKITRLKMK